MAGDIGCHYRPGFNWPMDGTMQWFGRKPSQFNFVSSEDGQDPRRHAPRHKADMLSCHLGDVVDISTTGVRIRCASKPPFSEGAVAGITFSFNGGQLPVKVQERWRKRLGLRGRYEIGMMFVNNPPKLAKAIESLVMFGFLCPDAVDDAKAKTDNKRQSKKKLRVSIQLPDYYDALQIPADADDQRIHTAYRKLARQYHPDANHAPDAQQRFISICEAYKVLSDPEQRKTYDMRRAG